jgi:hypothetical protein
VQLAELTPIQLALHFLIQARFASVCNQFSLLSEQVR